MQDTPADDPVQDGSEVPPRALGGGGIDTSPTWGDVDCSPEALSGDSGTEFTTAHYVVDGDLGEPCLGVEDPTLTAAWETLAAVTPGGQLADLALFAGFTGGDASDSQDEVTQAFVNVLDDDSLFQMSVNLDEIEADADEATLTMVHEFSHVFTALPSELDRTVPPGECANYDNGEGCYVTGSIMNDWVNEFWGDELADFDPSIESTATGGQERCDADSGFFGAYSASSPEEDFAESFSAYVLQLPTESPGQDSRYAFMQARPGLVEFRDMAAAAGYGPQDNNFDECGLGG